MLELMATGFQLDCVYRTEISVLANLRACGADAVVCTKNPSEWHVVPKLLEHDRDQWFIYMVRDPRDVVVSKHRLRPDVYWTNLYLWNRSWKSIESCRTHERLVLVRYEDLVRSPDQAQNEISRRVPYLARRNPFSLFHQHCSPSEQSVTALGGVRPISDARIGVWQEHKQRLAGQLKLHGPITETLIELGYEPDDRWLKQMQGVTPDTAEGHWPDVIDEEEQRQRIQRLEQALEVYLRSRGLVGATRD